MKKVPFWLKWSSICAPKSSVLLKFDIQQIGHISIDFSTEMSEFTCKFKLSRLDTKFLNFMMLSEIHV